MEECTSWSRSPVQPSSTASLWSLGVPSERVCQAEQTSRSLRLIGRKPSNSLSISCSFSLPGGTRKSFPASAVPCGVAIVIGPLVIAKPCSTSCFVASSGAPRTIPRMTRLMSASCAASSCPVESGASVTATHLRFDGLVAIPAILGRTVVDVKKLWQLIRSRAESGQVRCSPARSAPVGYNGPDSPGIARRTIEGDAMAGYETLLVDRPRTGITVATLNRPDRLHALSFQAFKDLFQLSQEIAADDATRVLVLTGAGRGFCAGLDLEDASTLPDMTASQFLREQESWAEAITSFQRLAKPVIAAVNGTAAGAGFSLALAADIRIAAPAARFNAAFIKVGLTGGDCGSSWMLPRVVGLGHAYEILLTGRFVDSGEAARIGLVNQMVPAEELLNEALRVAEMITENSPLGVALTKRVVQVNVDAPSLEAAVELENRNQTLAAGTHDMSEALRAFREKRPPVYTGR